ncbi:MAG: hypothetical protein GY753_09700 [Gammaproteobacteria bacterium]|nr:hypothetical protein [Gammaproteobacteria bacterium]
MRIQLTEIEQKLAKHIALRRIAEVEKAGCKSTIYSDAKLIDNTTASVGAELAFCRMHNTYPDLTGQSALEDAMLINGLFVDVKWTELEHGRLLVKAIPRDGAVNLYALLVGKYPNFRYAGWMTHEELVRPERIDPKLAHPAWAASQNELSQEELTLCQDSK